MRSIFFCTLLSLVFGSKNLNAQDYFITPPAVKTIDYANREITFSDVTLNGQKRTYLAVVPGEKVKITTRISSKRDGNYCPACIVQIYWGIRNYTSVCAKSFRAYTMTKKKSKHTFTAPMKAGIYYITMGGSLEYSCKNNLQRPRCSSDYAFAVLKVGNPDSEQKISLTKRKQDSVVFLKTEVVKAGAFGELDKLEWFFDGEKLDYDGKTEISVTRFGSYKALWSNCLTSVTDSINHNPNTDLIIPAVVPPVIEESDPEDIEDSDPKDIEVLIATKDVFVLENLIFDLDRAIITPEAAKELDKLVKIMKSKPNLKILLEGHTAIGNASKNLILSKNRVKSTKAYLVKQGVDSNNIDTKGWGQQKPLIITTNSERGRINRRVEIRILSR